jgi:HAD superfamily hydrolase (TIGR01549 family)
MLRNKLKYIEENIKKKELIVFDLDDTIFPEAIWLYSAYKQVSLIAFPGNIQKQKESLGVLIKIFQNEGRKNLFDKFVLLYPESKGTVEHYINLMRHQKIQGGLFVFPWINRIRKSILNKKIGILTNGNALQQVNKISQITDSIFRKSQFVICCDKYVRKPNPEGLVVLLNSASVNKEDCIFFGDQETDRVCAKSCGVDFIKVIKGF